MKAGLILLLALVPFIAAQQDWTHDLDTSSGFSACPAESRICAGSHRSCRNGKCACQPFWKGEPHLACHKRQYRVCSIISDPRIKTFKDEEGGPHKGIDLPLPCQFVATRVETEGKPNTPGYGVACSVTVLVAEKRAFGNFFAHGFQAIVDYQNLRTGESGEFYVAAYGQGLAGYYNYNLLSRESSSGPWDRDDSRNRMSKLTRVLGGDNKFRLLNNANLVEFRVERCGVEIYFRPADLTFDKIGDQKIMPGVSIGLDEEGFELVFNEKPGICLTPPDGEYGLADLIEETHMGNDEALLATAVESTKHYYFPDIDLDECDHTGEVLSDCGDVLDTKDAVNLCSFVFMYKPFAKCYSTEADSSDLTQLFNDCLHTFCPKQFIKYRCQRLKTDIINRRCVSKVPPVDLAVDCELLNFLETGEGPMPDFLSQITGTIPTGMDQIA